MEVYNNNNFHYHNNNENQKWSYDNIKEEFKDINSIDDFIKIFKSKSKHDRNNCIRFFNNLIWEDYPKSKKNKYGNINKGFENNEWKKFISNEDHYKAYFAWKIQYLRGLRIGEITTLNIKNISWERKTLKVWTLKAKQWDEVVINGEFEELLKEWINKYKEKIENSKGYLFFSDNPTMNNRTISQNWLRKQFGITRRKSKLDHTYGMTKETDKNRISRPQYILTTHSLRHSAITNFYNKSLDIIATMKFARHKDIKSTLVYIRSDINRVRNALEIGNYDKYGELIKQQIKEAINEVITSTTVKEFSCDREI